ncbi:tRNA uridine-5-carboxymethylaminomethyl(34) synthesis GTPase MnmE [Synechococcus sp. RSCCF101]|uniref:tRNA uridine-5-carboxymethylaminomethyl(34) synthesis GTPase MnmE n=1 Tax=Synechococcus sp. RSCCF101 TaxID=2511069 RepID=UPI001243E852|nr:tRNA uridine-5-carboxymethylaminomethyl(34) synthesis GTPase MnmE [Synechococcus sp. RSCCF101]QEY32826.1 tRNA uridine-5-carboxymethylaminomethyl(34) synthesis GTPase MnmE [Synechococcus sp. RSCCF101]
MVGEDTIAAVATAVAPAQGSVAIVRISGPEAEAIGRRLFRAPGRQTWDSHRVLYGHVEHPESGERIDEALLLLMRAPRSFTGEDVVELHCHGGLICVQRVLELVLAAGARPAGPGEFSQRAVLHGRMDLTRAEAVGQLVAARSRRAAQLAMAGLEGGLQRRIDAQRARLLDQLAELEARVDFEEDLPPFDGPGCVAALRQVQQALRAMAEEAGRAERYREGLTVAIVGRPNVGKSSLLNALARQERAIVTDLPGTTRDLVESELVLEGVPLTLLDTAGIRATSDPVERLGIARSHAALASADVVVLLYDLLAGWTPEDQALLQQLPEGVVPLVVGNKCDALAATGTSPALSEAAEIGPVQTDVRISALSGAGRDAFVAALLQRCGAGDGAGLQMALNRRQADLASRAAAALDGALEAAAQQLAWDFWTIDLRAALALLSELTGDDLSEAVLERVFSRFCIGK